MIKSYTGESIVAKLLDEDVLIAQDQTIEEVLQQLGKRLQACVPKSVSNLKGDAKIPVPPTRTSKIRRLSRFVRPDVFYRDDGELVFQPRKARVLGLFP